MTTEKTAADQQGAEKFPQLVKLRDTDQTVSSSDEDIRGRMAKDKDGHDLGTIEDLLLDVAERKVRFMEVASGGFLGLGESKSLIPVEAITRTTADAVYIGHTRKHVAGAPRYDPELVETGLDYFFNLYPYYGYRPSFGLSPFMVVSPDYESARSAAEGTQR
jgi:sporulation protein YlmC with PRC-barrel domain